MKKLQIFLSLFLLTSFTCISQVETKKTVLTRGKSELANGKKEGNFSFILPENISELEVYQNSSYYKLYFSVSFDITSNEAIIKMQTNDEKSRHIISRFLTSFGIEFVETDGDLYRVEKFYENFLK